MKKNNKPIKIKHIMLKTNVIMSRWFPKFIATTSCANRKCRLKGIWFGSYQIYSCKHAGAASSNYLIN